MPIANAHSYLTGVVGCRCEVADNPVGSVIHVDLGPLSNRSDDQPGARMHGRYCFTIRSPWRLIENSLVVSDWNDRGGSGGDIEAALGKLIGAVVIGVQVEEPGCDIRLLFANQSVLQVFADSDADDDAWFVIGTDGMLVKARPKGPGGGGLSLVSMQS